MRPVELRAIWRRLPIVVCAAAIVTAGTLPAPATPQQLQTLTLIDSLVGVSAFDSVLTLIPSILADAEASKDSALAARLLATKGRAEIMTGKLAGGIQSFDASIALARSVGDTTTWMTALGYKSLAIAWQGKYDDCFELNQTRLMLARLSGDRASEAWARTGLGYVHLLRGNLDESKTEYKTAVDLFRAENLPRAELTPLIGLGRVFNMLEDVESAREAYTRVWVVARDIGDRVQEAHAVNNLGTLEFSYGDISLAPTYFERAYQLHLAIGDPRGAITPAANVALARMFLGQFQGAADILIRAEEMCREGNFGSLLGSVLVKLGGVRYLQGRKHASAKLYRECLAIGDALTKRDHDEAVFGLARSLAEMDSTREAGKILKKGLEAPLPTLESYLKIIMVQCLRRLGRPKEALEYALEIEQRMETIDQPKYVTPAVELSYCYRDLGRDGEALDAFMMAVERLEGRWQYTASLLWREARGGTRELVDASGIVLEHPPDLPRSERIEALFNMFQRFKARTLLERITEPRRQAEPASEFADLSAATLSQLQQNVLEPNELFLDFIVGVDVSYLFAVTQDSCRVISLPGLQSDLPERVELFQRAIGKPPSSSGSNAGSEARGLQMALGNAILGEVADLVTGASRLLVVPDLYFGSLPFGLLIVEDGQEPKTALLDSKEIHYVPSATVLEWLRMKKRPIDTEAQLGAVLAFVPWDRGELEGVDREVKFLERRYSRISLAEGEGARTVIADTVASFEVIHVAAHIEVNDERPWRSGILLGEPPVAPDRGTRAVGIDIDDTDSESAPGGAGFGPADVRRDPYIRASDIAGRRLRAEMVVLSGCESALGRPYVGEGLSGLTSAFLSAGVPVTVAALWPVDDRLTAALMEKFYLSLDAGLPVVAALQKAQIAIRSRRQTHHPFYWAGFVAVGDGNVIIQLESKRAGVFYSFLMALAAVVAVLVGVVFWLRRKKLKKSFPVA